MTSDREYISLRDENPWEDSDWLPSHAEFLLPKDRLEKMLLETLVTEVTTDDFVTVTPADTMERALWRMRQHRTRAALVMEGEALVGIVTERDAVLRMEPGQTGAHLAVADVMTRDLILIGMDEPVGPPSSAWPWRGCTTCRSLMSSTPRSSASSRRAR